MWINPLFKEEAGTIRGMDTIKRHLVSALVTFISMFFLTLGAEIHAGGVVWSFAAELALLLTAVRAAFKAALEGLFNFSGDPTSL